MTSRISGTYKHKVRGWRTHSICDTLLSELRLGLTAVSNPEIQTHASFHIRFLSDPGVIALGMGAVEINMVCSKVQAKRQTRDRLFIRLI